MIFIISSKIRYILYIFIKQKSYNLYPLNPIKFKKNKIIDEIIWLFLLILFSIKNEQKNKKKYKKYTYLRYTLNFF